MESVPSLAACAPNDISVQEIPSLRRILLVDDTEAGTENAREVQRMKDVIKNTVDFREAFLWKEGVQEREEDAKIQANATCDDVINLQFTR